MAIQARQTQKQTVETSASDNSGSKWGQILGAVAGGALIVATGGAAAPAVLAAAGTGAMLGGMAGGAFNKDAQYGKQDVGAGAVDSAGSESQSTAMARRAAEKSKSELDALVQAEKSLSLVPQDIADEYGEPIRQAKALAQKKYGVA